jgi:fibronectin type III domain protein
MIGINISWLPAGLIGLLLSVAQISIPPVASATRPTGDGWFATARLHGHHIEGRPPTKFAPTASAQQIVQAELALKKPNRLGRALSSGLSAPNSSSRVRPRPQATLVTQPSLASPGDLMSFRSTKLATSMASVVDEPSVSVNGQVVFMTGNWYAAESTDSGHSFSYLDPFTEFPASYGGFCCDQQTIYDSGQNITIWLVQYSNDANGNNEQRLAVAHGKSGVSGNSWSYWDVTAQLVGFPSGDSLDYPKLEVDSTYLFQTTNVFTPADSYAGSIIFRWPLAGLAAGGTVTLAASSLGSTGSTITPVSGATSTMYLARHLSPSQLRIYIWPDSASSPSTADVTHSLFSAGPGTCAAPDGTNMCGNADSRIQAGWVANGAVGFMWNAGQDVNFPYPYVAAVRLNEANKSLIDEPDIWSASVAFQYPGVAVNGRGHLALTVAYAAGGYYPSSGIYVMDDLSGGLWQPAYGRAGSNGPPLNRWGDFLIVRAASGNLNSWVAGPFTFQGPCPGALCPNVEPRFVWFGRQRDDPFAPSGATGVNVTRQVGQTISNVAIATFLGPSAFAGDYSVAVNWGDGTTPSSGNAIGIGTAMTVIASHSYGAAGSFTITTTIIDNSGSSTIAVGLATISGLPSAPTAVQASAGAGVILNWTAPASDGGSAILGYKVTPYIGLVAQPALVFNSAATTQLLTGLAADVHYGFKIAAFNLVGTGPQSYMSNVISLRSSVSQSSSAPAPSRSPTNQLPSPAPSPSVSR